MREISSYFDNKLSHIIKIIFVEHSKIFYLYIQTKKCMNAFYEN